MNLLIIGRRIEDLATSGQVELSEFSDNHNLVPQQVASTAYGLPLPFRNTLHLGPAESAPLESAK